MKKKSLAVLLAAVSCLAVPVTAMAEEAEQTITVNLTADPTYTVTIPSSVSMDQNGTAVDVVAEDVENLQEGQKISVTIAGTSYYRNQLVVEADREDVSAGKVRQLRYQIISDDGELIETTGQDTAVGKEVVSFSGNETRQYQIKPLSTEFLERGVDYKGSITFGIAVVDAE